MAQEVILRGNVGGYIDLRDPDDRISCKEYYEWEQKVKRWHQRSEAAKKGWVTRRKNAKKK